MKFAEQSYEILSTDFKRDAVLSRIEKAARVCYQSEGKICEGSDVRILKMLLKNSHEAMIEHGPNLSVSFVLDRAIANELVRHRLFSFAQESTRWIDYTAGGNNHMTFMIPHGITDTEAAILLKRPWTLIDEYNDPDYKSLSLAARTIIDAFVTAEMKYCILRADGWKPGDARDVLSLGLKTQLVVTGNIRQWRNCLKLRTAPDAHYKIRDIMMQLVDELSLDIPELWEDISLQYIIN